MFVFWRLAAAAFSPLAAFFAARREHRDAPLMCIGEGTNEMQRIIIAKQLIARNPA